MQTTTQANDSTGARSDSMIAWGAILGGASASVGLSIILLFAGAGLGLAVISPWVSHGMSADSFGISVIVWIILTQVIAAGLAGYLSGRLRGSDAGEVSVNSDDAVFQDMAHGFLAWTIATIAVAVLAGTVIGKAVVTTIDMAGKTAAVAMHAGEAAGGQSNADSAAGNEELIQYMTDMLLRSEQPDPAHSSEAAVRLEAMRIVMNGIRTRTLPPEDKQYLAHVIAKRADLSIADADKRVGEVFNSIQTMISEAQESARHAADQAREAATLSSMWMFVAMAVASLTASYTAVIGGRQRGRMVMPAGLN